MEAMAVNLVRSYPTVAQAAVEDRVPPRTALLERLASITLGDWARVSARDAGNVQLVLGAYLGTIVSAYQVTGHTRVEENRVRWTGVPADEYAGLIDGPVPGGDWRKGQARPLRKVQVQSRPGDARAAMARLLDEMTRFNHDHEHRVRAETLEDQVSVRVQTPSTVVVRVPSGVSVLIHPYASSPSNATPLATRRG